MLKPLDLSQMRFKGGRQRRNFRWFLGPEPRPWGMRKTAGKADGDGEAVRGAGAAKAQGAAERRGDDN